MRSRDSLRAFEVRLPRRGRARRPTGDGANEKPSSVRAIRYGSHMAKLEVRRPPSGGSTRTCRGVPRSVRVKGTARMRSPWLNSLGDATSTGRLPACSRPAVGSRSASQTSPYAGEAARLSARVGHARRAARPHIVFETVQQGAVEFDASRRPTRPCPLDRPRYEQRRRGGPRTSLRPRRSRQLLDDVRNGAVITGRPVGQRAARLLTHADGR